MNNFTKAGMLTIALGSVFASANVNAELVVYGSGANAPGRCQAFTPGVSNVIRNRVVGSENIGPSNAVVCAFETGISDVSTNAIAVDMWFSNNATTGPVTVDCTFLNGWQGASGAVMVNKTVVVTAGSQSQITFTADDTPSTTDTDLGFNIVGVNCTLPTGAVINDTYVYWGDEDGIEAP